MSIFLLIVAIFVLIIILITDAVRPEHSSFSTFELNRRIEKGDRRAESALKREKHMKNVIALRDIIVLCLFCLLFVVLILRFNWWPGVGLCFLTIVFYVLSVQISPLTKIGRKLYYFFEEPTFNFFYRYPKITRLFGGKRYQQFEKDTVLGSRDELIHIVETSNLDTLNDDDKKLILNSLSFDSMLVSQIMTPRNEIVYLKQDELLGPLVLDDLHKTGHRQVPVIGTSIDHVVGIINLDTLLSLDKKRSVTAGKAITNKQSYIRSDQTLRQALIAFRTTNAPLLIVINQDKKIVGLITISDIIRALFGSENQDDVIDYDDIDIVSGD